MRVRAALIGAILFCSLAVLLQAAEDKYKLKVVYVGSPGTPRAQEFMQFLKERFIQAEAATREGFDPLTASGFDVVLLDWPQREVQVVITPGKVDRSSDLVADPSPIGPRDSWSKPTVLLGSAGLKLAEAWRIGGGYG